MRNPEITKEKILTEAGNLFNTKGYKATSISEITEATGLTKGAIYRHFENKEALENETLYFLSSILFGKVREVIKKEETAGNKLRAVFKFFETYTSNAPVIGGCPLLNAAIESDDAHPTLRMEALKILNILRESIENILLKGIKYNQLKKEIDPESLATIFIASLEGAIMMSKLSKDDTDIKRIVKHLEWLVSEIEL